MRKLVRADINVLRVLHKGKANKTTKKYIMAVTGLNQRAVYDSIEALRNVGIPVMASRNSRDSGYFIAETAEEKQAGIAQYRRQIATEKRSLDLLEQASLDDYMIDATFIDPLLWKELGTEMLEVTPTDTGAKVRVKGTL